MTKPVEVYPGDTLMLTRKITEDWFLLKPTPEVIALVGYMLVYWADRFDVELLAVIILGNHLHVLYRHRTGCGPQFCQMAEHWIARIQNRRLDRTGYHFFAPGPCRPKRSMTPRDVENDADYVVCNATLHGLTAGAYAWPGLLFGPEQAGEQLPFYRPPELDRSDVFPAQLVYEVPAPFHLRHLPVEEVHKKFRKRRKAIEAQEARRRKGRFLGVERALTVPKFSRPKNPKRSEFHPFFGSCDPSALAAAGASRAIFIKSHQARLERFRAGDHTSDWPPGTYKMRRTYGLPPP